jgi:hypothetical protein
MEQLFTLFLGPSFPAAPNIPGKRGNSFGRRESPVKKI